MHDIEARRTPKELWLFQILNEARTFNVGTIVPSLDFTEYMAMGTFVVVSCWKEEIPFTVQGLNVQFAYSDLLTHSVHFSLGFPCEESNCHRFGNMVFLRP